MTEIPYPDSANGATLWTANKRNARIGVDSNRSRLFGFNFADERFVNADFNLHFSHVGQLHQRLAFIDDAAFADLIFASPTTVSLSQRSRSRCFDDRFFHPLLEFFQSIFSQL